jgi:hypothetical protein
MYKVWQQSRFFSVIKRFFRILTIGDKLLIAFLFISSGFSFLWIKNIHASAKFCVVSVNGKVEWKIPLSENREIEVEGPLGQSHIEIKDGKVRMLDSPCPLKICVKSGYIDDPNDIIVCLPNRVIVNITGEEKFDGITW